jgi:hypothetical protein
LPDSSIYSDKRYTTNPIALGSWTNNYTRLSDSVSITLNGASVKLAPQIRIKLDDISFVSKLKNASSSDFGTTDNFKLFLKGCHIVPELGPLSPAQGGLAYMNLGAPSAAMVVYYTDSLGAQMKAEFPISGSSTAKGNLFSHTTLPSVMVQPAMGGTPQNTCYVQPAAGLKTRILFPYLFDFAKDKNIAITGAEVIVSTDQTRDTSVYKLPVWMVLNSSDSLGVAQLSFDLATSDGLYYYNGYYDGSQYHFNIQREIQYWFNQYKNHGRNINYGLNLIVPIANPVAANRAILDTRPGKIKLKLSYTVIN